MKFPNKTEKEVLIIFLRYYFSIISIRYSCKKGGEDNYDKYSQEKKDYIGYKLIYSKKL